MSPEAVAIGRNLALILLAIEAMVLAAPILVVSFYAVRYLPRVGAPAREKLRQIRQGTEQVEKATKLVSSIAVQPFLWSGAAAEGLKSGLGYLVKRR
jgi:hypothetical protein